MAGGQIANKGTLVYKTDFVGPALPRDWISIRGNAPTISNGIVSFQGVGVAPHLLFKRKLPTNFVIEYTSHNNTAWVKFPRIPAPAFGSTANQAQRHFGFRTTFPWTGTIGCAFWEMSYGSNYDGSTGDPLQTNGEVGNWPYPQAIRIEKRNGFMRVRWGEINSIQAGTNRNFDQMAIKIPRWERNAAVCFSANSGETGNISKFRLYDLGPR